jgi:SsrA-binding protein
MLLVENRKARFEYTVHEKMIAGVVLSGAEVKSLRLKQGSLAGSYVKEVNNEFWLINAHVNPYSFANNPDYEPRHSRKLLLSKKEVAMLQEKSKQKGWAIVPLAILLLHNRIKVEIALAKGKKAYEKKEVIKQRDLKREGRLD